MHSTETIRRLFIEFFAERGHTVVPSSSLIPKNDPTLLFTNAGMVQFKNVFQGTETLPFVTASTVQKCLRAGGKHNDLENVGRTKRHHTFFEMLGNFSFGDYFKEQAISYAFEFITKTLQINKDRLYITVYIDDDEAFTLWQQIGGFSENRIFKLDKKDNFWSMGDTGPCGPCSEIFVDQGIEMKCSDTCGIGICDCDRFLEIWNLVFMQYDQQKDGTLISLPKPSIDTGAGLERLAAICQGVSSNYDIDLFQDIISNIASKSDYSYGENGEEYDIALRVIADHSRAIAFMLADGILPSNEGRGYVLRRILRRACRFGKVLNIPSIFLYSVVSYITTVMGKFYPELSSNIAFSEDILRKEEESFLLTLDKGLAQLEEIIANICSKKQNVLPGDVAFKLYDTYGFPIDIINDVCHQHGLCIDTNTLNICITKQKEIARASWKGSNKNILSKIYTYLTQHSCTETQFVGYGTLSSQSTIMFLFDEEASPTTLLKEGDIGYIITEKSPFYATGGGQEGDTGSIVTLSGIAEVLTTTKSPSNCIIHHVKIISGLIEATKTDMHITTTKRVATQRNHTATHILHAVLRKFLGNHIRQAGSYVDNERLRFDFTHISSVTHEQLYSMEREVNKIILANIPVITEELSHSIAIEKGALGLFDDKYSDIVRVLTIGDESMELCGGTHVCSTGSIGTFVIISESSLASGVRRIEAVTGEVALLYIQEQRTLLSSLALELKCSVSGIQERLAALEQERKSLQKELQEMTEKLAISSSKTILSHKEEIVGIPAIFHTIANSSLKKVKCIMDDIRTAIPEGIACLAIQENQSKIIILIYVSKLLHSYYTAQDLIQEIAPFIHATGGGKADLAQAGGTNPSGLEEGFSHLRTYIASKKQ
ncbi:MAG: alanine--tRNA ligase [Desulfovibrionaceae bacterium]